jgi:hypothetical protein
VDIAAMIGLLDRLAALAVARRFMRGFNHVLDG